MVTDAVERALTDPPMELRVVRVDDDTLTLRWMPQEPTQALDVVANVPWWYWHASTRRIARWLGWTPQKNRWLGWRVK